MLTGWNNPTDLATTKNVAEFVATLADMADPSASMTRRHRLVCRRTPAPPR